MSRPASRSAFRNDFQRRSRRFRSIFGKIRPDVARISSLNSGFNCAANNPRGKVVISRYPMAMGRSVLSAIRHGVVIARGDGQ